MRKLTIKNIFIVNFEYISHFSLVFLLLTLSKQMPAGGRFRGTDSIQTNLTDNDDVTIARSCDLGKTLYFSFMKD